MKIRIYTDEGEGFVHYNPHSHEVLVTHPNDTVRKTVYRYLTSERSICLSTSDNIGEREDIDVTPTDNEGILQVCMCELFHITGIHVDWSYKRGDDEDE